MGIWKINDHIQIKVKMPNPSQEPPASSKSPNEDLKDIDSLCTFIIMIESQIMENWCTKDQWPYPNNHISKYILIYNPALQDFKY